MITKGMMDKVAIRMTGDATGVIYDIFLYDQKIASYDGNGKDITYFGILGETNIDVSKQSLEAQTVQRITNSSRVMMGELIRYLTWQHVINSSLGGFRD